VQFRLLDVIFVGFMIMAAYRGFQKGFLVELISTISLIVALFLSLYLINTVFSTLLKENFSKAGPFSAFIVLYFVIVMAIIGFGRVLKKILKFTFFDTLDNFIGMILAVAKYLVALSFLMAILTYVGFIDGSNPKDPIHETVFYDRLMILYEYIMQIARTMAPQFIDEMQKQIQNVLK
ncbi:MAG: CvpA family protein, partial [Bacteroidota bacterium]